MLLIRHLFVLIIYYISPNTAQDNSQHYYSESKYDWRNPDLIPVKSNENQKEIHKIKLNPELYSPICSTHILKTVENEHGHVLNETKEYLVSIVTPKHIPTNVWIHKSNLTRVNLSQVQHSAGIQYETIKKHGDLIHRAKKIIKCSPGSGPGKDAKRVTILVNPASQTMEISHDNMDNEEYPSLFFKETHPAEEINSEVGKRIKNIVYDLVTEINKKQFNLFDKGYMAKYTDANKKIYCFMVYLDHIIYSPCKNDTFNIPSVPLVNGKFIVKHKGFEKQLYCSEFAKGTLKQVKCPMDTSILLNVHEFASVQKYIEPNGNVNCFKVLEHKVEVLTCPEDTSDLAYVKYKTNEFLVKYVDDNLKTNCFTFFNKAALLRTCPYDLTSIPMLVVNGNHIPYIVKYIDSYAKFHCFKMQSNIIEPTSCPVSVKSLNSLPNIPMVNNKLIAMHVDSQQVMHCLEFVNGIFITTNCQYMYPVLILPSLNNVVYIAGFLDERDNLFCFKVYNMKSIDQIACPMNTTNLIMLKFPNNRFVAKYHDRKNRVKCISTHNGNIQKTTCPPDTSNLMKLNTIKEQYGGDNQSPNYRRAESKPRKKYLSNGHIVGKYQGKCVIHHEGAMILNPCSVDINKLNTTILKLPAEPHLEKFTDENHVTHCFVANKNKYKYISCPKDSSNLPTFPKTNGKLLFNYKDKRSGLNQCMELNGNTCKQVQCPNNAADLPSLTNIDNLYMEVKYKDNGGNLYCLKYYKNNIEVVPCPSGPTDPNDVTVNDAITAIYFDRWNILHCTEFFNGAIMFMKCPADIRNIPRILYLDRIPNIEKYVDSDSVVYCFKENHNTITAIQCPEDSDYLLESPLINNKFIVKFVTPYSEEIDCAEFYKGIYPAVDCPEDLHSVREVTDLEEKIYKTYGNQNEMICLDLYKNSFIFIACPSNTEHLPDYPLANDQFMALYKNEFDEMECIDLYDGLVNTIPCPTDTSKLSILEERNSYLAKHKHPEKEIQCYEVLEHTIKNHRCPDTISQLPTVPSINNLFLTTKYIDSQDQTICYELFSDLLYEVTCPRNVSDLPVLSSENEIGKISGENEDYCYIAHGIYIQPVVCPDDDSTVSNGIINQWYIAKEANPETVDNCLKVRGWQMKDATNITCPSDTSILPEYKEIKIFKDYITKYYTDNMSKEYCYYIKEFYLFQINCPEFNMYLPLLNEQNSIKISKIEDPEKIDEIKCYAVYNDFVQLIECPDDKSNISELTESSEQWFITVERSNDNKVEKCFKNFIDNGNKKISTLCPYETKYLQTISSKSVTKYMDGENNLHCFEKEEEFLNEVICPEDTTNLAPVDKFDDSIFVGQYQNAEDNLTCAIVYDDFLNEISCPSDMSNVQNIVPTDDQWVMKKITDEFDMEECIQVYVNSNDIEPIPCPNSTLFITHLSTNSANLVDEKYIYNNLRRYHCQENHEFCFQTFEDFIYPIFCPVNTTSIPFLDIPNGLPLVKTYDVENDMQCFIEIESEQFLQSVICPNDMSKLPIAHLKQKWYMTKYIDFNEEVKCLQVYADRMINAICPPHAASLPCAPISKYLPWLAKYIDSQDETKCMTIRGHQYQEDHCPEDLDLLPLVDLIDYSMKFSKHFKTTNDVTILVKDFIELIKSLHTNIDDKELHNIIRQSKIGDIISKLR